MSLKSSLLYKFMLPLLIGGLLVALLGSYYIYHSTQKEADRDLLSEGRTVASALNHSAMVAHNASEVQHVVEEVHNSNPQLALTIIISDDKVLASSIPQWVNLPSDQIPDSQILSSLQTHDHPQHNDHHTHGVIWKGKEYGKILIDLGQHLSQHRHTHSDLVTDHIGASKSHHDNAQSTPTQDHTSNNPSPYRGKILLLMDRSRVSELAVDSAIRMVMVFVVAIVITLFLSFRLMSRKVLDPLEAIAETMRQNETGDKTARAPVNDLDELSHLASILNHMLDTLGNNEKSLKQLNQAIEQSPTSVVITDPEGVIEYVNPRFCESTGFAPDELIGQKPSRIKSGLTPLQTYQELWSTIKSGQQWRGELHNQHKDGQLFWENVIISPILDEQGNITQFLGIKEDITVRKEYEEQLIRQANFDELTGLPNRILAQDRLHQALAAAHRTGGKSRVALLFVDLDDFKKINDTLGHEVGDQMIQEVGIRFKNNVRETDTVARFGGDEFLIIMTEVHRQTDVEIMAEKLMQQLARPFQLGGMSFVVTASIGIALYPDDGEDVQHLLQDADAAMNRSKQEGSGNFRFFTSSMNDEAMEHLKLEEALSHALKRNQLEVHFQPVIDFHNGDIVGAEALLRWHHPEMGNIPPFKFIPLAERNNLILPIGKWVLMESCRIASNWVEQKQGNFRIAINLSAKQFGSRRILDEVNEALEISGLPPQNLELEFTESVLMRGDDETMQVINELHDLGIRFAIDDFGTGYSSISYLRKYPFDTLKIDRSFVMDVVTNPGDEALVRSIIAMAKSLDMEILAEGIEEWPQFEFLQAAGAQRCQGWLFSKALSTKDFTREMRDWKLLDSR